MLMPRGLAKASKPSPAIDAPLLPLTFQVTVACSIVVEAESLI